MTNGWDKKTGGVQLSITALILGEERGRGSQLPS